MLSRGSTESARLSNEPQRSAEWRRVIVQLTEEAGSHGARLVRRPGDQRALLTSIQATNAAGSPGREPSEVGHHAPRLRPQLDDALSRLKPPPTSTYANRPPADFKSLYRLMGELTRNSCQ